MYTGVRGSICLESRYPDRCYIHQTNFLRGCIIPNILKSSSIKYLTIKYLSTVQNFNYKTTDYGQPLSFLNTREQYEGSRFTQNPFNTLDITTHGHNQRLIFSITLGRLKQNERETWEREESSQTKNKTTVERYRIVNADIYRIRTSRSLWRFNLLRWYFFWIKTKLWKKEAMIKKIGFR